MDIFKTLINLIFPPRCVACKKPSFKEMFESVCDDCLKSVPVRRGFRCSECGGYLPEPRPFCHPKEGFVVAAAADYKNRVIRELIHALKYKNMRHAAEPLAHIINSYLEKSRSEIIKLRPSKQEKGTICMPLPLSPKRQKERTFNQSSLLACLVFKSRPIKEGILLKTKNIKPQTECDNYEERALNIAGAFEVAEPEFIKGKGIILIDDVYTSGATAREAVNSLKNAGAKRVLVLVAAKTGN